MEKLETLQTAFTHREALQPRPLYGPIDWEFLDFEANYKLTTLLAARTFCFQMALSTSYTYTPMVGNVSRLGQHCTYWTLEV
jgi:hypothetical protein